MDQLGQKAQGLERKIDKLLEKEQQRDPEKDLSDLTNLIELRIQGFDMEPEVREGILYALEDLLGI